MIYSFLKVFLIIILAGTVTIVSAKDVSIYSPDKKVEVVFIIKDQQAFYKVRYNGKDVLLESKLGIIQRNADFSQGLSLTKTAAYSPVKLVTDNYTSINAKKSSISYRANELVIHLQNAENKKMDITFRVSNDGVGFRYFFPNPTKEKQLITKEVTTYHFPDTAKAWIQPLAAPKSGWEKTNPSYEENYFQNVDVGTASIIGHGWVYPAMFRSNNTWLLITEADLDSNFCGSRLNNDAGNTEYFVDYPTDIEVFTGKGSKPNSTSSWYSPWRIITIGSLKTVIESTLGTDLAKRPTKADYSFVKPGKASWSWINSKDNYIIFSEQKKYIDYAADMKWQYCLIDADWDIKIGYDSIKILADYAKQKNIDLLLWYNSSGDWNTVKYSPKSKLLTAEDRAKEFSRIQEMGIKGVKIDFFGGDGQSMIKYYHDILVDAAKYKLAVNFHGATLPRGWSRTYPHLVTTEAVKGFEMITFEQKAADEAANHCAMLPFTRNAFDPMDFTPMNLYKIQTRVKRKTTAAFELATSVLFLSGIQHFAESPEGMKHVPEFVKKFLRTIPNNWDDVKYITGFPGKEVVIARRKGTKWYVAGINGEGTLKTLNLDLAFVKNKQAQLLEDTDAQTLFTEKQITVASTGKTEITMKPNGGFVMVF
ncbi:MAG: glycoside hydrolase family 97 protein [Segetibacter sp.]|nr:glycoside hydrolase family 97 protein [Segetibacter sp.]